ncbi:molybdenum cofactor guanylyltransferase MobA [Chelativorans sp. AA-79]|uniref:molybdenum cofactor guanylyltransferase MobA n=1 Tax=Chelativorans sp. AA-79 TaxID=3028735 RepID=UPI003211E90D
MGGGDKSLRTIAGRPILTHVIDRLRPQVACMAINANGDAARFGSFALPVISDPLPGLGPLGGVLAGLAWARAQACPYVTTVACDTPFFPRDLVEHFLEAADGASRIVLGSSGGRIHPTFAFWPVSLADDLEAFLRTNGAASMRSYAGGRDEPIVVDFSIEGGVDPFFNINTKQDLDAAERIAAGSKR